MPCLQNMDTEGGEADYILYYFGYCSEVHVMYVCLNWIQRKYSYMFLYAILIDCFLNRGKYS